MAGEEAIVNTEEAVIESSILTPEEVKEVIASDEEVAPTPEVVLPSDKVEDPLANLSHEELLAKVKELSAPKEETTPEPTPPSAELVQEYLAKFNENGKALTEADYADLESKGYNKEFVDTYVAGVKAANVKAAEELTKDFGGLEKFNEAKVWAGQNWTADEISVFDKAISTANESDDKSTVKVLLNSLMKEYTGAQAKPNAPIHTNTPVKPEVQGYSSKSDMQSDMSDKRYGKDAVYTHAVEAKMGLTDTASWYK